MWKEGSLIDVNSFFDMNILGGAVAGYTGDNALMSAWRTAKTHVRLSSPLLFLSMMI